MNLRRVFIRNWEIDALTGIHPHEADKKQRLRLNIGLYQEDAPVMGIDDVVDYSAHKNRMQAVLEAKHYPLLEMIGEALAQAAFEDAKVRRVKIKIEKLDLYPGIESCGVKIDRSR